MSRGWHNEGVAEARGPKSSKYEINVRVSHQCSTRKSGEPEVSRVHAALCTSRVINLN
jgi:hypothetical protein